MTALEMAPLRTASRAAVTACRYVSMSTPGVTVYEDDYVIADRCGTVFVPAAKIDEVLALAQRIASRQDGMVQAVRAGQSVEDVMHDKKFEAIKA